MKQVLLKRGNVALENIPAPLIEPNSILVEVAYSLISSGTELSSIKGSKESLAKKAIRKPEYIKELLKYFKKIGIKKTISKVEQRIKSSSPLGYSCSGYVLQVGEGVEDIKTGDRVACAGGGKAFHAEVVLIPKNLAVKIPQGCDLKDAASIALGSIAMHGIRRADVRLGENVAIIGLGLLGQVTTQLLSISGCRTIGADLDEERVKLAEKLGLKKGFVPSESNLGREVLNFTSGHGVDATIITASSPSSEIIQQAMENTRKKGRVVIVGDVGLELKRHPLYEKEIDVLISCSYGPGRYDSIYEENGLDYPYSFVRWTEKRNMEEYLRLIAENKFDFKSLVSDVYNINNAPEAYQKLLSDEKRPLSILLDYNIKSFKKKEKLKTKIKTRKLMKKPNIINVGIIGAGGFAKNTHLLNLKKLSKFYHIKAIADIIGHNAKDVASAFGAEYCTTNYKDILADPEIDVVIITTRHNLHAKIAIDAAKAGKAVLTEKPMALNQIELDELIQVIKNTNVPFTVGFNRRFSPSAVKTKAVIAKRMNPIIINYRVHAAYLPQEHWVYTDEGGGRIIGEACHMLDLFNYFTDSSVENIEVTSVTPNTSDCLSSDNFIVTLKYVDGSVCSLIYSSLGTDELGKEYIEIFADGKVITIDDFKILRMIGTKTKESKTRLIQKGHYEELIAFVKCVKEGTELPIPMNQLISATEISFIIDEKINNT
ncbi:MAG: bi-domain-containing oxidoreductase [Candidatus Aminicenantes bacterium]|nr:MAG: bi-domain-containing oxidoreductase [Candidatus Aminicenantes bacterium]